MSKFNPGMLGTNPSGGLYRQASGSPALNSTPDNFNTQLFEALGIVKRLSEECSTIHENSQINSGVRDLCELLSKLPSREEDIYASVSELNKGIGDIIGNTAFRVVEYVDPDPTKHRPPLTRMFLDDGSSLPVDQIPTDSYMKYNMDKFDHPYASCEDADTGTVISIEEGRCEGGDEMQVYFTSKEDKRMACARIPATSTQKAEAFVMYWPVDGDKIPTRKEFEKAVVDFGMCEFYEECEGDIDSKYAEPLKRFQFTVDKYGLRTDAPVVMQAAVVEYDNAEEVEQIIADARVRANHTASSTSGSSQRNSSQRLESTPATSQQSPVPLSNKDKKERKEKKQRIREERERLRKRMQELSELEEQERQARKAEKEREKKEKAEKKERERKERKERKKAKKQNASAESSSAANADAGTSATVLAAAVPASAPAPTSAPVASTSRHPAPPAEDTFNPMDYEGNEFLEYTVAESMRPTVHGAPLKRTYGTLLELPEPSAEDGAIIQDLLTRDNMHFSDEFRRQNGLAPLASTSSAPPTAPTASTSSVPAPAPAGSASTSASSVPAPAPVAPTSTSASSTRAPATAPVPSTSTSARTPIHARTTDRYASSTGNQTNEWLNHTRAETLRVDPHGAPPHRTYTYVLEMPQGSERDVEEAGRVLVRWGAPEEWLESMGFNPDGTPWSHPARPGNVSNWQPRSLRRENAQVWDTDTGLLFTAPVAGGTHRYPIPVRRENAQVWDAETGLPIRNPAGRSQAEPPAASSQTQPRESSLQTAEPALSAEIRPRPLTREYAQVWDSASGSVTSGGLVPPTSPLASASTSTPSPVKNSNEGEGSKKRSRTSEEDDTTGTRSKRTRTSNNQAALTSSDGPVTRGRKRARDDADQDSEEESPTNRRKL